MGLNLIGARRLINAYKKESIEAKTLTRDQQEFLDKLLERLIELEEGVRYYRSIQTLVPNGKFDKDRIVKKYKKALSFTDFYFSLLLLEVNKEQNKYVNIASAENYKKLLAELTNSFNDMADECIKRLKIKPIAIKDILDSVLHKLGFALGAIYIPFHQRLSPLFGNDLDDSGYCHGYVKKWLALFLRSGKVKGMVVLDEETQDYQENQIKRVSLCQNDVSPGKFIKNMLGEMQDDNLYLISLKAREAAGHSVGIRKNSKYGVIEYFDPNLGHFIFHNEKKFRDWFTLCIVAYIVVKKHYLTNMTFFSFGAVPKALCDTAELSFTYDCPKETQAFNDVLRSSKRFSNIFDDFLELFKTLNNPPRNIYSVEVRQLLVEFIEAISNNITDVKLMESIRKKFVGHELVKYLQDNTSFISSIFYSKDTTVDAVLKLIDEKIKLLLKSQTDTFQEKKAIRANT